MKRKAPILLLAAAALVIVLVYWLTRPPSRLVLTGIVTTDEVIVSPEIQGRLERLLVNEGDMVTNGQLLAVIQPKEWKAELAFYSKTAEQSVSEVAQSEAQLRFQEAQTSNQIEQAQANLGATQAELAQAQADLENADLTYQRETDLYHRGVDPVQDYDRARTARAAAQARVEAVKKQVAVAESGVALAKANEDQVAMRRAGLEANRAQAGAAAAQKEKAEVRLGYTRLLAPTNGIVDKRVALEGETVSPAQPVLTLINPDDLWVRADVEETYIERIHLGDQLQVTLPSGEKRVGTVFYRSVDADYATQRDVSRTKRDIKTFEIRLRCDNRDRSLAVGMTAYVALPLKARPAE